MRWTQASAHTLAKISAAQAPEGPPPTTATRMGLSRSMETVARALAGARIAPKLRPRAAMER
eukprot:scaffold187400_cov33-Tisochrysis_lutea.AAC.1